MATYRNYKPGFPDGKPRTLQRGHSIRNIVPGPALSAPLPKQDIGPGAPARVTLVRLSGGAARRSVWRRILEKLLG